MLTRRAGTSPSVVPTSFPLKSTVFWGLGAAVLAGLLLRTFVVGAITVPSPSMENTLLPGDFVLVNKLVAIRWIHPVLPGGAMLHTPVRLPPLRRVAIGDVVVFSPPARAPYSGTRRAYFVKRCIGTPGDILRFERGTVTVNGRPLGFPPGAVQATMPADFFPEPTTIVVPEGSYFMVGDNSARSIDSRQWGAVPEESILGTAVFIYWSLDHSSSGHDRTVVRWSRVATRVF